jgi:hypothetical protein
MRKLRNKQKITKNEKKITKNEKKIHYVITIKNFVITF